MQFISRKMSSSEYRKAEFEYHHSQMKQLKESYVSGLASQQTMLAEIAMLEEKMVKLKSNIQEKQAKIARLQSLSELDPYIYDDDVWIPEWMKEFEMPSPPPSPTRPSSPSSFASYSPPPDADLDTWIRECEKTIDT